MAIPVNSPAHHIVAVHKIGTNRGKRRIWLEGKRVLAAGFTPGMTYWQSITPGQGTICLTIHGAGGMSPHDWKQRKVSGKGEKPILDLIGSSVSDTFPDYVETVTVTYAGGTITIVPKI